MRNARHREHVSWCRDPELDRQIKQRVARNNMFMIAVAVVIIGCLMLK